MSHQRYRPIRAIASGLALLALTACQERDDAVEAAPVAAATPAGGLQMVSLQHAPRPLPSDPRLLARLGDPTKRLLPLLVALGEIESGKADHPIDIVQIGDSHTANSAFAGRMRELFQARFGAAGRGMLPPGIPFDYYKPLLVTVDEAQRWTLSSSFRQNDLGPWGMAGVRETGNRPGERMQLTALEDSGFARAAIEVLRRPGAGAVDIRIDDGPVRSIPTGGPEARADWIELPAAQGSRVMTATPHGDGPVEILSWDTERTGPGVLYENFGTIGATVDLIGHWDKAILKDEFAHRDTALIIVAFGTNEGFGHVADPDAYRQMFVERVRGLHEAAPGAAILIIGPPDGNRLYRRAAGQSGDCAAQIAPDTPSAGKPGAASKPGKGAIWAPPPGLAKVRQAERQAAAENGWYFWDWSAAMGGACMMHRWVDAEPPLAMPDHVHLKADGYRLGAQQLFAELMAEFDRYHDIRLAHPSSAVLR